MEQPASKSVFRDHATWRVLIAVCAAGFLCYALGHFIYYHFALSDRLARLFAFL